MKPQIPDEMAIQEGIADMGQASHAGAKVPSGDLDQSHAATMSIIDQVVENNPESSEARDGRIENLKKSTNFAILFTDDKHRTTGMMAVEYAQGDTSPSILRHSVEKDGGAGKNQYAHAYLLDPQHGFSATPFYSASAEDMEHGFEVESALRNLQNMADKAVRADSRNAA